MDGIKVVFTFVQNFFGCLPAEVVYIATFSFAGSIIICVLKRF